MTINENYPEEFKTTLEALYSKFSTDPTDAQRMNILITEVGDCCVAYSGMSRDSEEEFNRMKICILELDYLQKIGVYQPEYC